MDPAADAGITCLPIPTPFGIGDVNTYLLDGDPLTLVDCGPNSASAFLALEQQLAALGRRVEDIELVLITHQHIDHMGLAHLLAARGAEIACLDLLAPVLEDWERHAIQDDDDALLLMNRHGVEDHVADALRAMADVVRGWGAGCRVDRRLADGELLALGHRELRVAHRPGHSPSDTLFIDDERGIVIGGDHLIAGVSSNALMARPLDGWDGRRPPTLLSYRESLRATRADAPALVLGGHREPVTDAVALIDQRLAAHERRAESFYDKLAAGPRTAHELASETWGQTAFTQVFLTLSEVLGHLDLLIHEGRVREDRSEHIIRFERAG
ncbi:MAG TPA: MBL fold metallo-hydrolase [Baekduia sp.]|nr:MBL fold metallo-hydrolase [Baekduia sp.]